MSKTGKCPFAGELLEVAIGVAPMMEILQSSLGRAPGGEPGAIVLHSPGFRSCSMTVDREAS